MKKYDVDVDIRVKAATFDGEAVPPDLEDALRGIIEEETLLTTERVFRAIWKVRYGGQS